MCKAQDRTDQLQMKRGPHFEPLPEAARFFSPEITLVIQQSVWCLRFLLALCRGPGDGGPTLSLGALGVA